MLQNSPAAQPGVFVLTTATGYQERPSTASGSPVTHSCTPNDNSSRIGNPVPGPSRRRSGPSVTLIMSVRWKTLRLGLWPLPLSETLAFGLLRTGVGSILRCV
jgi:hypothetical protein